MKNYPSKILFRKVRFISLVFLFFFFSYLWTACAVPPPPPHSPPLSPPDLKPPVYGKFYKPNSSGPFPAVVLLHGGHGVYPRYNVDAERLAQNGYDQLKKLGKEVELNIYPGEEHGFDNEDAQNRVLNFLNQHLKK